MRKPQRLWWIAGVGLIGGMLGIGLLFWWPHSTRIPDLTEKDILEARKKLGAATQSPEAKLPALSADETLRLAVGTLGFSDPAPGANQELGA